MISHASARVRRWLFGGLGAAALCGAGCDPFGQIRSPCLPSAPAKVVIVVEENHGYSQIIGNPDAPYINRLAREGANFTRAYAVWHPSQPNYIALFGGRTFGITDDHVHDHAIFITPNLGSKLLAAGLTFVGYSESLPEAGWDGEKANDPAGGSYQRKHNPWVNWQDARVPLPANKLPPAVNQPFSAFPGDFADLPTVSMVVPNQKNDMHDGSVAQGDAWLERNIGPYVEWARTHNGLLILTFDEDNGLEFNRIVTVFHGPMVQPGEYSEMVNHYTVLRTVEDLYGLPPDGTTAPPGPLPCEIWKK